MTKYFLKNVGIAFFPFLSLALIISCTNGKNPKPQKDSIQETSIASSKKDSDTVRNSKTIPNIDSIQPLDSSKKYVLLTFDDGPQPGTGNVIQAIKETEIKASFFMVGIHATFSPLMRSYVDQIRNGYPEFLLSNHSYSHAFNDHYMAFYHNPYGAYNDFLRADSALRVPEHIFRLPGNNAWVLGNGKKRGSHLVHPLINIIDSLKGNVIGWDVEWHFKRNPHGSGSVPIQGAQLMAKQLINTLEKGETYHKNCVVMLAHDRMFHLPNYKDSLVAMINIVKQQHPEYIFETVEKL